MLSPFLVAATLFAAFAGGALGQRTTPLFPGFPGQGSLPTLSEIINLNATNGTFLPLQNIQGDIFVGMRKPKETLYFFTITDPPLFKTKFKANVHSLITSAATMLDIPANQPLAFVNVAFSQSGLTSLGITDNLGDAQFAAGQFADAANLGDNTEEWETPFKGTSIHGVFLIGSDSASLVSSKATQLWNFLSGTVSLKYQLDGSARPGSQFGHEHFGFLDGISQPAISGFATNVLPGQAIIPTGQILTGRLGDTGVRPLSGWMLDGSFLAFRKLKQNVPEFNKYLNDHPVQNAAGTLTTQQGADLLGARMVGRWKSGAPIDITPDVDDPALGVNPQQNNNFDYAHVGSLIVSDQSKCPFSAHIRKTRPRADQANLNIINHVIRAGIPYGPEVTSPEQSSQVTSVDRGLAFVSYQSSIFNGFRFQQIQWANNPNFPTPKLTTPGIEPIIGQAGGGALRTVNGLDPVNPGSSSLSIPQFVVPKGGEYFFVPSISQLKNKVLA